MLNSIRETRLVEGGLHKIKLEMPKKIYNNFYKTVNHGNAYDILQQYLNYHQDDARPTDVSIDVDENSSIIQISANLHYLGNDKTETKYYSRI